MPFSYLKKVLFLIFLFTIILGKYAFDMQIWKENWVRSTELERFMFIAHKFATPSQTKNSGSFGKSLRLRTAMRTLLEKCFVLRDPSRLHTTYRLTSCRLKWLQLHPQLQLPLMDRVRITFLKFPVYLRTHF